MKSFVGVIRDKGFYYFEVKTPDLYRGSVQNSITPDMFVEFIEAHLREAMFPRVVLSPF